MSDLDAFLDDDRTGVVRRLCTTALSPSRLPGLDLALNPYTRCGHDCGYCYAPYVMRTSPLEWGKEIIAKVNIPQQLAKELPRKRGVIGLGTVTDPYQPLEREMLLTRRCLEEMAKARSKVSILTKSDLVLRDMDILRGMAGAEVGVTLNTASDERARVFEAGSPPPSQRLKAVQTLVAGGIKTYVFLGPIIPTITDQDIPSLVRAIGGTGVSSVMIDRLNLRPGMKERMRGIMVERSPSTLAAFEGSVEDDGFYSKITGLLVERLRGSGVRTVNAF